MIKIVTIVMLAVAAGTALAQTTLSNPPMVPYTLPLGPGMTGGLGGPMIPGNVGAITPPPPLDCNGVADFGDGCAVAFFGH